ncbi:MAG: preprotein translocase subunit YajC, partial [Fibrobacterota bacterium]
MGRDLVPLPPFTPPKDASMSASVQPSLVESISSFLPIILVFGAMMWFMSIRPAMKRQKEQDEMMKNLAKG